MKIFKIVLDFIYIFTVEVCFFKGFDVTTNEDAYQQEQFSETNCFKLLQLEVTTGCQRWKIGVSFFLKKWKL